METNSDSDEFDIIEKYFAPLSLANSAALNLKDDIAFLPSVMLQKGLVVTTDTISQNIHFRSEDPIETIASKIARVNLSDIIAKGCRPIGAFLNLTWPKSRNQNEIPVFAQRLSQELENIPLLGGDTSKSENDLIISLTLFGEPLNNEPILRNGAKIGDLIYVTGTIGDAYLGLAALQSGDISGFAKCTGHYQEPNIPPKSCANLIANIATAALDVSDGLLGDAQKLGRASEVGISIEIDSVPLSDEARNYLSQSADAKETLEKLCSFGDDYQSLFCVPPNLEANLIDMAQNLGINITRIGHCTKDLGLKVSFNGNQFDLGPNLSYRHNFS